MNTRWAHYACAITVNSKWTHNNRTLQIKYYPVKSYYQEKRHITFFMVTPWWVSILSLFLKPGSCISPSATQNMNKNILSLLGLFMSSHWCLQFRSNSYMGEICSLMSMSKFPWMLTEARVPLCLPQLFLRTWRSLHSWKPPPQTAMFLTYLFHPGHYVLPQSQLMALDCSQPQAFPNLFVWEPNLFGSPQYLFRNCFTGIKSEKHLCVRLCRNT